MRHFTRYWLPWYLYLAGIFLISSLSLRVGGKPLVIVDTVAHFSEYFILGVLTFRAFSQSKIAFLRDRHLLTGAVFCFMFGLSDEIHQYFVPWRYFSLQDLFCDLLGICVAMFIYSLRRRVA